MRELRNVIERASLFLRDDVIRPADLLLRNNLEPLPAKEGLDTRTIQEIIPLKEVKRLHILSALKACSDNKSQAARALGISLSTLKRKLKEINT